MFLRLLVEYPVRPDGLRCLGDRVIGLDGRVNDLGDGIEQLADGVLARLESRTFLWLPVRCEITAGSEFTQWFVSIVIHDHLYSLSKSVLPVIISIVKHLQKTQTKTEQISHF